MPLFIPPQDGGGGGVTDHGALTGLGDDDHPQYTTDAEAGVIAAAAAEDAVEAHEAAGDPHAGYQLESEKGQANGYASLDGSGDVPDAQIPDTITRDTELAAHVDDEADAHDASAISILDTAGDFDADNVEDALAELQADHETDAAALSAHISDAVDAHEASAIGVTPFSTIEADNVQDALEEIFAEAGGGGGGGSGTDFSREVEQLIHGLAVGDVVRLDGTDYVEAQADSEEGAEVVGIVSAVEDADNFTLLFGGRITGLSGLTAGTVYFLSPSSAGALTATEPTTAGEVSKPVLIADSTTSGYFFNFRGAVVPSIAVKEDSPTVTLSSPLHQQAWPDAATNYLEVLWKVPNDYAGGDVSFNVFRRVVGGASGTAVMLYGVYRLREGSSLTTVVNNVSVNFGPANAQSTLLTVTVDEADFQVGDVVRLQLWRVGADGSDDLAAAVQLDGVWMEYEATG